MNPEISVVMATYRQSEWLLQSMLSIVPQVKYPGELRVVAVLTHKDVKGDDETVSMLEDWFDLFFNLTPGRAIYCFEREPNLWKQRQRGLNDTKNPYVCFFDSDDVMLLGWLERGMSVAKEITARGKIPIVGPSYRMVDEKLRPMQDVILPEFTLNGMKDSCIIPDFSITRTENLKEAFEIGCKVAREKFTPQYSMLCSWWEMLTRFDCEVRLLPDIGFLYRQHHKAMHNRFKRSKRASRKNVEMVHRIARNYFPTGGRDMKQDGTQA